jgi:hypothetical protein
MSEADDLKAASKEAARLKAAASEVKRQRALAMRRIDPDIPIYVIAARLGVSHWTVKKWLSGP